MSASRSVELTPAEADFVVKLVDAIQFQGRDNILLAAGLLLKIEAAAGPALDSLERELAAADAKEL
jgi:hypothetical protein